MGEKVYGGSLDGRTRLIVKAPSMAAALRALHAAGHHNVSLYYLRVYWSQTWNKDDLAAMADKPSGAVMKGPP